MKFLKRTKHLDKHVLGGVFRDVQTAQQPRAQPEHRLVMTTHKLSEQIPIALPYATPGYRHVVHLYVIETRDPARRDAMLDFLVDNGVDAKTHYSIAIHDQAGYPWGKPARIAGSVANAERNAASCVSLPMFPELTRDEVDHVIGKVMEWDKANA